MAKASVLLAEGFEEGEALTIIDILRRANIECSIISTTGNLLVTGSHNITVQANELLTKKVEDYDMIVLPGGLPGATNLRDNNEVILTIQNMAKNNKFVCAMCAAPIVLEKAGLLEGKYFTAYVGYDEKIKTTGIFKEDIVVVDKNIITSRGPATVYAFAYKLIDALGGDSLAVKNRMVYFNSFNAE